MFKQRRKNLIYKAYRNIKETTARRMENRKALKVSEK